MASALFAEPPTATYAEALGHFLQAENLSKDHSWKENKLCIAKCRIKMGDIGEGVKVLKEANQISDNSGVSENH